MLEAMPMGARSALIAVAMAAAACMGAVGSEALALGVLANLAAGLAFSQRGLLKQWKGILSWAMVWALAALVFLVLVMWPLSKLLADHGLHAALGVSAVLAAAVVWVWRYAPAWRMHDVFANDAFKRAAEAARIAAWSWTDLGVAVSVVLALASVLAFAWPGVLTGQMRWIAAGGAAAFIPLLHFIKRPRDLAMPQAGAKGKSTKAPASKGFASNAEKIALDAWPELSPVADVASVLPGVELPGVKHAPATVESRDDETTSVEALTEAPPSRTPFEQMQLDAELHEAARAGRVDRALECLAQGADARAMPEAGHRDQRSLAVLAAILPDLRLLRGLIERGVDLNPADPALAPLAVATRDSWHGRPEAVATLLANGADARRVDARGNTALHHAAHSTDPAVAALLLDAAAEINALNIDGITPVLVAAMSGNWRVAKFLIERGAKLNVEGAIPALNAAARCDDDDAAGVELFFKHKAKADATDSEGRNPLHVAARLGHIGIFQTLLDHGVALHAVDAQGRGVVHHAVEGEASADFVQELLHIGARADMADVEDLTPAQRARTQGQWALVSVLDPGFKPVADPALAATERVPYAAVTDALASNDGRAARDYAKGLTDGERIRLFEEFGLQDPTLVEWLLAHGVDAQAVNRDGVSLASLALRKSAPQAFKVLWDAGAQLSGRGEFARALTQVLAQPAGALLNEGAARQWLERGADAFGANTRGDAPLHLAVQAHYSHLVADLVARGADPNAQNAQGMTPLHFAVKAGDRGMVRALVAAGASPRFRASDGQTALGLALASGRKDLAEWVDWRLWPPPGRRLRAQDLPAAAIAGDVPAVQRLLELGFDVNTRDGQGCTALLRAAGGGHAELLDRLLAQGADPSIAANSGATPLSAAVSMRNEPAAERLLDAGADLEQRLPGDVTVLMLASALGLPKMASVLIRRGAQIGAVDAQGLTALHCACLFAFNAQDRTAAVTLIDSLLLAGADPDPSGSPAVAPVLLLLGARAEPGMATDETVILSVLDQLLAESVSLQVKDARGFGPLHVAALHGLMQALRMLLRAGADPSALDALNRSPREVALMRGFVDIATELATRDTAKPVSMASLLRPHAPPAKD